MRVFVFGSNLAGRHGLGAARTALLWHGAVYGCGIGIAGNSYAIPTKDGAFKTLPLDEVAKHVSTFLDYARAYPESGFQVTRIGCGLAGFTNEQIAPLFKDAPENCEFDDQWKPYLPGKKFWGTY